MINTVALVACDVLHTAFYKPWDDVVTMRAPIVGVRAYGYELFTMEAGDILPDSGALHWLHGRCNVLLIGNLAGLNSFRTSVT